MRKALVSFALASLVVLAAPARAADPATAAMQAAYAPYRAALFQTNFRKATESEQAIEQARAAWKTVLDRFADAPPSPYSRDPAFAATLVRVHGIFDKAATEAREGRLGEAHETLEAVRDELAALRRRNNVIVWSDHVDAYHAEMEHLLRDGPALLREPQGPMKFMARVGALEYLVGVLRDRAPPALGQDAEFGQLLKSVEASVAALREATLGQDANAVVDAMNRLKAPYSRLFLKFG